MIAHASRRFSPACAGNALMPSTAIESQPVQPRVCGERVARSIDARLPPRGSAPRVRGTPRCYGHRASHALGSAPRVRGTLASMRRAMRRAPVQPRVCGERQRQSCRTAVDAGSAPRVRGTLRKLRSSRRHRAVQPRVCGERVRRAQCRRHAVQPRVCGERHLRHASNRSPAGSAPRVRGTHDRDRSASGRDRFSPACAGNARHAHCRHCRLAGSAPRVRGTLLDMCDIMATAGSAPRVRGTRRVAAPIELRARFSPACAGNAGRPSTSGIAEPVQPRVCGERAHDAH